jgi:hypothetical protein
MMRAMLPIALLASVVFGATYAPAETKIKLKSITVDLPVGPMFPDGPHADAVNNNCLGCHSAGMVLNQPALSKAQWKAEVNKMRMVYKAPIDAKGRSDCRLPGEPQGGKQSALANRPLPLTGHRRPNGVRPPLATGSVRRGLSHWCGGRD